MNGEASSTVRSRERAVGGKRWHILDAGAEEAPVVVLVHGLGVSARYMVPVMRQLAGRFRVLAPDLPGFGRSSDPAEPLGPAGLADALAGWMEAEGLASAALLGNSLGCQVIAHLAERHPTRVRRAVLVSPTMDPGAPDARRQIARLLLDAPRERWPMPLIAFRDYLDAGTVRVLRTLGAALGDPAADHYRRIDAPTLVIRGGRDPIVSAAWAREVARLMPDGRLVTIPGAPHAVNFSAPEALSRAIVPFLIGTDGG